MAVPPFLRRSSVTAPYRNDTFTHDSRFATPSSGAVDSSGAAATPSACDARPTIPGVMPDHGIACAARRSRHVSIRPRPGGLAPYPHDLTTSASGVPLCGRQRRRKRRHSPQRRVRPRFERQTFPWTEVWGHGVRCVADQLEAALARRVRERPRIRPQLADRVLDEIVGISGGESGCPTGAFHSSTSAAQSEGGVGGRRGGWAACDSCSGAAPGTVAAPVDAAPHRRAGRTSWSPSRPKRTCGRRRQARRRSVRRRSGPPPARRLCRDVRPRRTRNHGPPRGAPAETTVTRGASARLTPRCRPVGADEQVTFPVALPSLPSRGLGRANGSPHRRPVRMSMRPPSPATRASEVLRGVRRRSVRRRSAPLRGARATAVGARGFRGRDTVLAMAFKATR